LGPQPDLRRRVSDGDRYPNTVLMPIFERWIPAPRIPIWRRKEGGMVELSENWAETHQSCRLAPAQQGPRPLFMGTGKASGDALLKNSVAIEAISCILLEADKPKWKSRVECRELPASPVSCCVRCFPRLRQGKHWMTGE
jgi:hypothetical protein